MTNNEAMMVRKLVAAVKASLDALMSFVDTVEDTGAPRAPFNVEDFLWGAVSRASKAPEQATEPNTNLNQNPDQNTNQNPDQNQNPNPVPSVSPASSSILYKPSDDNYNRPAEAPIEETLPNLSPKPAPVPEKKRKYTKRVDSAMVLEWAWEFGGGKEGKPIDVNETANKFWNFGDRYETDARHACNNFLREMARKGVLKVNKVDNRFTTFELLPNWRKASEKKRPGVKKTKLPDHTRHFQCDDEGSFAESAKKVIDSLDMDKLAEIAKEDM